MKSLDIREQKEISGGMMPWGPLVALFAATGAAASWAFDKGEALGKSIA